MEELPLELINRIVWYAESWSCGGEPDTKRLFRPQFRSLATINALWKEAVETITFQQLDFQSNELDVFRTTITGARRHYVKDIKFTPLLPAYSLETRAPVQSEKEQCNLDQVFSNAVYEFLTILRAWEDDGVCTALGVTLMPPISPTDDQRSSSAVNQLINDIRNNRRRNAGLHLQRPERLPVLSNIKRIEVRSEWQYFLAPSCVGPNFRHGIIDRLHTGPNLGKALQFVEDISWSFPDWENSNENDCNTAGNLALTRMRHRSDFAQALSQNPLLACKTAEMRFDYPDPIDETIMGPVVIPPNVAYDPFSTALRMFSQGLTTLDIHSACLSAETFWPSPNENKNALPTWPNMKSFKICFSTLAPNGTCYFTDPFVSDDPDTTRRIYPNSETIDPFFAAFIKAVLNMPKLEYFRLSADFPRDIFADFNIECNVCNTFKEEQPDPRTIHFWYEGKTSWVPPSETMEALRTLGQDRFGGPLIGKHSGGYLDESDDSMAFSSDGPTDETTDGRDDE